MKLDELLSMRHVPSDIPKKIVLSNSRKTHIHVCKLKSSYTIRKKVIYIFIKIIYILQKFVRIKIFQSTDETFEVSYKEEKAIYYFLPKNNIKTYVVT